MRLMLLEIPFFLSFFWGGGVGGVVSFFFFKFISGPL